MFQNDRSRLNRHEDESLTQAEKMSLFQLNRATYKHDKLCELIAAFMKLNPDNPRYNVIEFVAKQIIADCDKVLILAMELKNGLKCHYNRQPRSDTMSKLVEMMKDGMEDDQQNTKHIIDFIVTGTNRIKQIYAIKDE